MLRPVRARTALQVRVLYFISRDYIDLQLECSADKFLGCEEKDHVRSMSPSPQGYEASLCGPSSPWIVDRTSGMFRSNISPVVPYFPYMADAPKLPPPRIMNQPIGTPLSAAPVYTHVPHTVDVSQRYSGMIRSRRNVPSALPSPTITPTFGLFDLSNQSGISPTFEEE